MKIFHSFDTKLKEKEYKKAVFIFWKDKILMISRCFAFIFFNWILPFFAWIIFASFSIILYFYTKSFYEPLAVLFLIIWWLFTIYLFYKFYLIFLNYKFDFCIITPEELITHKQKWIFKSSYKNIPVEKIKSVQSRHKWFFWNIFNFWNITILTDWWIAAEKDEMEDIDSSWAWIIRLTSVHRPNKTKKKILLLCIHKWKLSDIKDNKYKI